MKNKGLNFFKMFFVLAVLFLIVVFLVSPDAKIRIDTKDYDTLCYVDGIRLIKFKGDDKDVHVPNHIGIFPVIAIGSSCFEDNQNIETVIIPNNVKYIRSFAFSGCDNLKSVKACRIKSVERCAFSKCGRLESVELGDKLKIIEDGAFIDCEALSYVPSKSSLKEIQAFAFAGCGIKDPGDLSGITVGEFAFDNTPWKNGETSDEASTDESKDDNSAEE